MIDQVIIVISTVVTMLLADEQSLDNDGVGGAASAQTCGGLNAFIDLFASLKNMSPAMFRVLALTAFTWVRPDSTDQSYNYIRRV